MLISALIGALSLVACGEGSGDPTAGSGATSGSLAQLSSDPASSSAVRHLPLTSADAQKVRASALRSRFVREVAAGSRLRAAGVVPWAPEGGGTLLGGITKIDLRPAVRFANQKLPATISPNRKAPPGTPTLYRFIQMSAENVSQLEVQIKLPSGRAVRIEPSGGEYEITKAELIGPPPTSSAYAPEPGY